MMTYTTITKIIIWVVVITNGTIEYPWKTKFSRIYTNFPRTTLSYNFVYQIIPRAFNSKYLFTVLAVSFCGGVSIACIPY